MEAAPHSWRCPYCNQIATLIYENVSKDIHFFNKKNKSGDLGLETTIIVCPNRSCQEFTISATLYYANIYKNSLPPGTDHPHLIGEKKDQIITWRLKPQSSAKPFPDYIPLPIRQDYEEACLIVHLSPKSSATLSRRCLQGMIRDFWRIRKRTLYEEIQALQGEVDTTTWQAIDAVRKLGNIGAHMEKDIGLIIDVDPDEATLLIGLIEVLLQEWYIRRYEREQHMQQIIAAAKAKQDARAEGPGLND